MSKTKLERKLKIIKEYRKKGSSDSSRAAKRNRKHSIKQKLDKFLKEGYE